MNTALLNLRKRQIIYEIKQLGIYSIVLLGIFLYLIYYSLNIYQDNSYALLITFSLAFLCLSIQSIRRDKEFIYLHSENYHLSIYTEYFLLTFPFIVMSLFTQHWYCFPLLQILLYLITYNKFSIKQKTIFKNISEIISVNDFEWISGFRKSFTAIIPVYLLALGFSWLKILPLILLWYLTMIIITFYNECEPLIILREREFSVKDFLNKKLVSHISYLTVLYMPVLIINTIFNSNFLLLNIFFILSQAALLFFAVCYKYSNYIPNKFLYLNNFIVILVSLFGLIPVFLPVPVIIGIRYYFNARNNLKQYFND
jgi:hypothetical protein